VETKGYICPQLFYTNIGLYPFAFLRRREIWGSGCIAVFMD